MVGRYRGIIFRRLVGHWKVFHGRFSMVRGPSDFFACSGNLGDQGNLGNLLSGVACLIGSIGRLVFQGLCKNVNPKARLSIGQQRHPLFAGWVRNLPSSIMLFLLSLSTFSLLFRIRVVVHLRALYPGSWKAETLWLCQGIVKSPFTTYIWPNNGGCSQSLPFAIKPAYGNRLKPILGCHIWPGPLRCG